MSDGSVSTTAHARGSLLDQWKLLQAAIHDQRLSRGDLAVLFDVLDNYYRRHGNSRAAYSYLAAATGLSRRAVINSVKRLRTHGYLDIARLGSGTRPTEYVPNWLGASKDFTSISGEAQITSEANSASPLAAPEMKAASPKPSYVAGLQAGLRKEGPAPVVPPGGLDRPPAPPARDPFDELWNAYGRKQERSKAKAEYRKLDPDPALHALLIRAAADWKATYETQARPSRFRKHLHIWLAGECWLEDGPEPYATRKVARTSKRREREIDEEYRTWLLAHLRPGDRALARFIDWMELECTTDRVVYDFDFAVLNGRNIVGRFVRRMVNPSEEFDQLRAACGKAVCVEDFPGTLLRVIMRDDGSIGFEPYEQAGITKHPGHLTLPR